MSTEHFTLHAKNGNEMHFALTTEPNGIGGVSYTAEWRDVPMATGYARTHEAAKAIFVEHWNYPAPTQTREQVVYAEHGRDVQGEV